MQKLSDADLVAKCLEGKEAAWEELLRRHGRLIFSTARRMGLSAMDAEDIFQNVCILLLENLHTLREGTRLTGWLMIVTRRETLRWLKRQRPHEPFPEIEPASDAPVPEQELLLLADRHLIDIGIGKLSERCQRLLVSLYLTDPAPNYETVAQEHGWPVGSVGPNRARCLEKLKKELEMLGF
jgi:RNA polymerase sigma factor (sigma-70 family)